MNEQINSLIQDLRRQTEYCTKEDLLKAADFLEELGDRCDELAADKGTYFRLYEALCIKVEADKKAKITQIRDTKFAKLIVKECADLCDRYQEIPATEPRHAIHDSATVIHKGTRMNKLIAKLYDQAIVIEDGGDYVCGELDPVKFAELIVRECAKIADIADESKCEWIGGNILIHFGVEE